MFPKVNRLRTNFGGLSTYSPPEIRYLNSRGIIIPGGRYLQAGYRSNQSYQFQHSQKYWEVESSFYVDLSTTFAAGTSSGRLGGLDPSNWYSVFMLGSSTTDIILLPYLRAWSVDYNISNSGQTTITIGRDVSPDLLESGLLTGADLWNTYGLMKCSVGIFNSDVMVIKDCVESTLYERVTIEGNAIIQNKLSVGDIFQIVPPPNVPCLYLGSIRTDSSGSLRKFVKSKWRYTWTGGLPFVYGVSSTTSSGDTIVSDGVSPLATRAWLSTRSWDGGSVNRCRYRHALYSPDGNLVVNQDFAESGTTAVDDYTRWEVTTEWTFFQSQVIKNQFVAYDTAGTAYTTTGGFRFLAFEE